MKIIELLHLFEEKKSFEKELVYWTENLPVSSKILKESILYSVCSPGKRLRPAIIFFLGKRLGLSVQDLMPLAISIELMHCSSLIIDDLPSMDNAELRRHLPTCWKKFGEGVATLSGYALVFLSTISILRHSYEDMTKNFLIDYLCQMSIGMTDGQTYDIVQDLSIGHEMLTELKTGCLFRFCFVAPLIVANRLEDMKAFETIAQICSIIFQHRDDLLDNASSQQTGKSSEQDKNKKTMSANFSGFIDELIVKSKNLVSSKVLPENDFHQLILWMRDRAA